MNKTMVTMAMMAISFIIGAVMTIVLQENNTVEQEEVVSASSSQHDIATEIVLFGAKAYTLQPNSVVCKKSTSCDVTRIKIQ